MAITDDMIDYAKGMIDGRIPVNKARIAAAKRFLKDLDNPEYFINETNVIFCILLIEKTFVHIKGPARGEPFKLEMWQKFIIFNLVGFELKSNPGERRFKEAFIYIPRKNSKTFFASALAWALAMLEREKYAVLYIIATKLDRAREAFDNILDNIRIMGEEKNFRIQDNNSEHSIRRDFGTGKLHIQALAADAKRADGLNANLIILDEIHGYKSSNDYFVYKQAMKAYQNKLLIGITTAGANMNSFCYNRLLYCKDVINGIVEDEQYFIFIAEADDPNDYLNPHQHEIANPNYGVTIRPEDILSEAQQAQNDPQSRTEFLNKSLNIYVNTLNAYFNLDEFRESDDAYDWSLEELAQLPIHWYGGADLSKLHDLTAGCLYGEYDGVDICITHAFFPLEAALTKAQDDNIPLFGWKDDGWLTMSNTKSVQVDDIVNWFVKMRDMGFDIDHVGFDRKFSADFVDLMRWQGFKVVETPQLYIIKSQGFRRIEQKVKNKKFYYLHSQAYEYCVENVKAIEKVDDMIQFEKVSNNQRIDLFDSSVFACYELIQGKHKEQEFEDWLNND